MCREHASSLPTPFTEKEFDELVAYAFAKVSFQILYVKYLRSTC